MRVRVEITRRPGIADPEGTTVARALLDLGYDGVRSVHFGKTIDIDLETDDPGEAEAAVAEMCDRLLANPVMEDYAIRRLEGTPDA